MNNKETIDQVERGYRMANPVHIVYPESKTHPKEVAQSQSNVYKVHNINLCIRSTYSSFRSCWSAGKRTHSRGQHLNSWRICLKTSL